MVVMDSFAVPMQIYVFWLVFLYSRARAGDS